MGYTFAAVLAAALNVGYQGGATPTTVSAAAMVLSAAQLTNQTPSDARSNQFEDPSSNYRLGATSPAHLEVHAADWWTAVNVGLNEVELRPQGSSVHYRVRYWRWAGYALVLSATIGLFGLVLLLTVDVRGYIEREENSILPRLSVDQNLLIAWLMVLFWGFVWPWLLIAMHKRPLHKLVGRLIRDVDAQASTSDETVGR